jgi:hypothetical protein
MSHMGSSEHGSMGHKIGVLQARFLILSMHTWLGFGTGNPQVRFSHTVPVPIYTAPVTGTYPSRPVNFAVSNETRGTHSFFSL